MRQKMTFKNYKPLLAKSFLLFYAILNIQNGNAAESQAEMVQWINKKAAGSDYAPPAQVFIDFKKAYENADYNTQINFSKIFKHLRTEYNEADAALTTLAKEWESDKNLQKYSHITQQGLNHSASYSAYSGTVQPSYHAPAPAPAPAPAHYYSPAPQQPSYLSNTTPAAYNGLQNSSLIYPPSYQPPHQQNASSAAYAPSYSSASSGIEAEVRELLAIKAAGTYFAGPSEVFQNFKEAYLKTNGQNRTQICNIFQTLKARDGADSAIATMALEFKNKGMPGLLAMNPAKAPNVIDNSSRYAPENPSFSHSYAAPAGGGNARSSAAYAPSQYQQNDWAYAQRLEERKRQEERDSQAARRLQNELLAQSDHALAQQLQAEEERRINMPAVNRYPEPLKEAHPRNVPVAAPIPAPAPAPAAAQRAVPAAAPQAPQNIVAEQVNYQESQTIQEAYNAVMQDLQRPHQARIKELEREIHQQQRVVDSVAGDPNHDYTAEQIQQARNQLATFERELAGLVEESAKTMDGYAEQFTQAATPNVKIQTPGVQAILRKLQEKGQQISHGKILYYLQEIMGW